MIDAMDESPRARREAELVAYYDNELHERADRALPTARVARRTKFVDLLLREEVDSVLEVGAGPGRDGAVFAAAGLAYTGVDLAPQSAVIARSLGLDVRVASVLDLPFEDATFGAGWTMSTLLHVADGDLDAALAEIIRVLRPGAPLAIGLWGNETGGEYHWDDSSAHGPARFFSIRTDDTLRTTLARHGTLEEWLTWRDGGSMHYQWAVLRTAQRRTSETELRRT
ncbi:class I SAM-dependent methyltransferase [Nocardia goodfellowii]|uniref:SAM-dependent methyltransferase n=1 Tax=Nocardia goodfellowii TaxID=882446 RepID=A0ABS4QI34_9NOCA|nr:class I SAM-dependent methyltransferase [Nocardia goodfellowii]MBP2190763.1 SAM-dependent methyltransferase [Nocardia goodfellowii]